MNEKHLGGTLDDFLAEEGWLEQATAIAVKRVIAWQIAHEMKLQKLTKTLMAERMRTSRAALNRLLDETDTSLTLTTLASAASALGKHVKIELEDTAVALDTKVKAKQKKPRAKAVAEAA